MVQEHEGCFEILGIVVQRLVIIVQIIHQVTDEYQIVGLKGRQIPLLRIDLLIGLALGLRRELLSLLQLRLHILIMCRRLIDQVEESLVLQQEIEDVLRLLILHHGHWLLVLRLQDVDGRVVWVERGVNPGPILPLRALYVGRQQVVDIIFLVTLGQAQVIGVLLLDLLASLELIRSRRPSLL